MARIDGPAANLRVYFVTVDPERDTRAILGAYMKSFHPHIVALTGERAAVNEALGGFGAIARRTDFPNGQYTYGHTAAVFLVDADGLIVDRVGIDGGVDALAARLAALAKDAPPASGP